MKKTYISPVVLTLRMATTGIIAASVQPTTVGGYDLVDEGASGDASDAMSRHVDLWADDEE